VDATGSVGIRNFADSPLADMAGSDLRCEVAFALARRAHVGENQVEHLAIDYAGAHNAHWRDSDSFLIDFFGRTHRSRVPAADIGVMSAIGDVEVGPGRTVEKDGQDHGDVGQVGPARIGVVEYGNVAGREGDGGDRGLNRHGH